MKLEEAKKYIKMIILRQEIPDSAKALGYVYAEEAIETVLNELENKDAVINEMAKELYIEGYCKNIKCKKCEAENFIDCIKEKIYKKVGKNNE